MKNKNIYAAYILLSAWLILFLIAGFREPGFDRDSFTYIELIKLPLDSLWFQEPTFVLFVIINKFLFSGSFRTFFLLYAILGVGIKVYALSKLGRGFLLALVIYILLYYALHDLTQIRVGVASGLFLLSLFYLEDDKKKAFVLQFVAILFHYSAIIGLLTLLLSPTKINKWFWASAVLISVSVSKFMTQGFVLATADFMPDAISTKINNYINILNLKGIFMDFNQYNFFYLGCVFIFFVGLFLINRNKNKDIALFILATKILALMLISYYLLAPVPVMAGRISEFFGIVLIVYLPMVANFIKPRWFGILSVMVFICIHAVRLNLDILNF